MAKALQTNRIKGPAGKELVIAWMDDGRIRLKLNGRISVSALYPGKNINPEAKLVITPL